MSYDKYKVEDFLPEGADGNWKVERFTVSEEESDLDMLRSLGRGGRYVRPGTYTRLTRNGAVIMSDTSDEIRDHLGAIMQATGRVLIHGLGLGMVARACLLKPEVTHVTIVERSSSVVKIVGIPLLVAPFSGGGNLETAPVAWRPPGSGSSRRTPTPGNLTRENAGTWPGTISGTTSARTT